MGRHRNVVRGWVLLGSLLMACGGSENAEPDGGPGPVGNMPDAKTPFEGIPDASVPIGTAPLGCESGFDAKTGKLALTLNAEVASVKLSVIDGAVAANDVACSADDGMPATAATVRDIHVMGTNADELVLVDLSTGAFGAMLLAAKPGIVVDLGGGKDEIGLVATGGNDDIQLGSQAGNALMRFAKDGVQINAANVESAAVGLGPGNDKLSATGGGSLGSALSVALKVYGGDGFDEIQGGDGDDLLSGGGDDDLLLTDDAADGNDTYDGGDGVDTLSYERRTASLVVTIDDMGGDGEAGEEDNVLTSVENLVGGTAADQLTGSAADNRITGGEGDDQLNGGDGDDTFVESGAVQGTDVIHGGAGSDLIDYSGRTADLRVVVCQPTPEECQSGACDCLAENGTANEHDTLVGVEGALTGSGDDDLIGDGNGNYFVAGPGDDHLDGAGGNDSLYGDEGDDVLVGGSGEDLLYGGMGTDSLDAGAGQGDICIFEPGETALDCELK